MAEGRSSVELVSLPPGTRVGHYSILEKLGEGGEAVVYRARDLVLERDVALKTPRCDIASSKERAHLLNEARAASRLSHPAIVPIYEVFEDQDKPWFAMSLVEGSTLRNLLGQRGPFSAEVVARHGETLASALQAAHEKQVLHRDITPANIFITPDGRLMLADFGLAQIPLPPAPVIGTNSETVSASREHVAGTLGYMSPEQMMGRPVGPQSDIFSAGVVLYQMATGVRPFRGSSFGEVLDATLNQQPAPVSSQSQVPSDLDHIIRKALAKRPDERYASAGDMCVDLRAVRRRLESGTHGVKPAPEPRRWAGRVVVAVATVAVLAAAGAWAWQMLRPAGLPEATPHQVTSGSGWEAEAKISPDGRYIVYTAEGPDGNIDIWLVDALGTSTPHRLTHDPSPDHSPAWYPDGSALAFVSERGGVEAVWRVPILGGSEVCLIDHASSPALSPDGTRIAFIRAGENGYSRVFVARTNDPSSAAPLSEYPLGAWNHRSPAWSPTERLICYAAHRNLWLVDPDTRKARQLTADGEVDTSPAWSHDGRFVYFSSERAGTVALWRVATQGGVPARVSAGLGPELQPSISADGSRLVYSTLRANYDIAVIDHDSGRDVAALGSQRTDVSPAFSSNRRALVFVSDRSAGRYSIWRQDLDPAGVPLGQAVQLTDLPGAAGHPSLSPDGRWVAFFRSVKEVRSIWTVPLEGGQPEPLSPDGIKGLHPEWSPDGAWLAFAAWSEAQPGDLGIWRVQMSGRTAVGRPQRITSGPTHMQPSWSHDSEWLVFVATDHQGGSDVWLIRADGSGSPRQITRGVQIHRAVWGTSNRTLLASGFWGGQELTLKEVDVATGASRSEGPPRPFGLGADRADFNTSFDGRLIAVPRRIATSDVWMSESRRGTY